MPPRCIPVERDSFGSIIIPEGFELVTARKYLIQKEDYATYATRVMWDKHLCVHGFTLGTVLARWSNALVIRPVKVLAETLPVNAVQAYTASGKRVRALGF